MRRRGNRENWEELSQSEKEYLPPFPLQSRGKLCIVEATIFSHTK